MFCFIKINPSFGYLKSILKVSYGSNEFKKDLNMIDLFILYLRYVDLLDTYLNLLDDFFMKKALEIIKIYKKKLISDKNTYNLYTTLYESHIKPLEDKINEILNKI